MELKKWKMELQDHVATLTIDNPPVNILSSPVMAELEALIDEVNSNNEIKVAVLTGTGSVFIAGADIKEIFRIGNKKEGEALARKGQKIFSRIENSPKPFIAAINGVCLGGGTELAMACHIRIAGEQAHLGQPEISLGLIPGFGGTQRLARLTNKSTAMELILSGEGITAQEAFRIGLVNRVVADEDVLKAAQELGGKIALKGGVAIAKSLDAIHNGLDMTLEEGLEYEAKLFGETCETEDMKEGVAAFLEKRAPQFKNK